MKDLSESTMHRQAGETVAIMIEIMQDAIKTNKATNEEAGEAIRGLGKFLEIYTRGEEYEAVPVKKTKRPGVYCSHGERQCSFCTTGPCDSRYVIKAEG